MHFFKKLFSQTTEYKSKKNVLPAPKKHSKIPNNAIWHAGEGAGSWFSFCKTETFNWQINRYSEAGEIECSSIFYCDKDFNWDSNEIKIVYPSNCAVVNLNLGENTISLYNTELYNHY